MLLQRADDEDVPCYLETLTGGLRFYKRQGFAILRSDRVAGGELTFWTMKQKPGRKR